ncbi:MAG: diaminopimelate decarboxylase [Candidatus Desulforudis sp.]|nr:diaminopimelate decarboxylase [Desulforudis sp.]
MRFHGTMWVNPAGHLEIGRCDTVELARVFETPLYVLDEELFRENCRAYQRVFGTRGGRVIYAGKAGLNLAICRILAEEDVGLDVVSGGELYTAVQGRFPMSRVYFHGNNKTPAELRMALEAGIHRIVVDNLDELELLGRLTAEHGAEADILLRLSPGIEAHTHEYIRTGQIDSKFGLVIPGGQALEGVRRSLETDGVRLRGLHCHIGSQIFELEPYAEAARVLLGFARQAREETGWTIEELDLGGGLGIYCSAGDDPPSVESLAETIFGAVAEAAGRHGLPVPEVAVEPGRSIAGPAGTTLYTVGTIKQIPEVPRTYVAVDGGMGDNPRPALYGARYEACLANKADREPDTTVSLAGRCCESGDMLIWDARIPAVKGGDIVAVSCTGAYTYSMSGNYNRFPRPAMVLVRDGQAELIVRRESYADLIRNDIVPARSRRRMG